jgi:dephospho-CoA kinase
LPPPEPVPTSAFRVPRLLNIALTGNIAAGKTSVVDLFRRWGATVIDADALVREAQAPGTTTLAAIASRFGGDVLSADGSLDRAALRAKVMGDDTALSALNALVHPVVRRRRDELQKEATARGDLLLINDIPLLFEALDPAVFDSIVLVDAPVAVRRARLRALRHLSNEDADRMIAAQMTADRKRARSEFVIDNDGSMAELEPRARKVFDALRERGARASWGTIPGPVALVADNPKDPDVEALRLFGAALATAGVTVYRVAGKAPTIQKALGNVPPASVVATPLAADNASTAQRRSGIVPALQRLGTDGDRGTGKTVYDLRPWGGAYITLSDNR